MTKSWKFLKVTTLILNSYFAENFFHILKKCIFKVVPRFLEKKPQKMSKKYNFVFNSSPFFSSFSFFLPKNTQKILKTDKMFEFCKIVRLFKCKSFRGVCFYIKKKNYYYKMFPFFFGQKIAENPQIEIQKFQKCFFIFKEKNWMFPFFRSKNWEKIGIFRVNEITKTLLSQFQTWINVFSSFLKKKCF